MRSYLTLTLVLLAAISGQSADANELVKSHHPLLLLMAAGNCQVDQTDANFSFAPDTVSYSSATLRTAPHACEIALPVAEPASKSHESALVSSIPVHGP